jgi:uncharacterized protein
VIPLKVTIAGGFGVGKTTFVHAISDIVPLTTEAVMTTASEGIDRPRTNTGKGTTTVAMDFGRMTVGGDQLLYLFGTPGQDRFRFLWDELCRGAIGAVVLVDTRRLEQSFDAIDYFEHRCMPFVVAVNCFYGVASHGEEDIREALAVRPEVPVLNVDARYRSSARRAIIELTRQALSKAA